MLTCKQCGHTWYARAGHPPKSCPKCGSARWNYVPIPECPVCCLCPTHNPNGQTPTPAPAAPKNPILDRFNTLVIPDDSEPKTATCTKCSHEWQSRTDAPKQCPKCQARLDADVGAKAEKRAKYCAAGPLAEEDPNAARYSWDVCDWTGAGGRWKEPKLYGWIRREHLTPKEG